MTAVGAHTASEAGVNRAEHMSQLLVEYNVAIASGFARGLVTATHHTAINSAGQPIALLGTVITKCKQQAIEAYARRLPNTDRQSPNSGDPLTWTGNPPWRAGHRDPRP